MENSAINKLINNLKSLEEISKDWQDTINSENNKEINNKEINKSQIKAWKKFIKEDINNCLYHILDSLADAEDQAY